MKRAYFWLAVLLLIFVAVSSREHIEVSDRAMVHAVGIDGTDSGVKVTVQIFKSDGSGGDTQIDPSKPNVMTVTAEGKTFEEAFTECQNRIGGYLFIGHNQIIVFGSSVSFDKPDKLLEYFIQNKDNYMGVNIVLAEDSAEKLLNVPLTSGATASENFAEVIEMYQENSESPATDMLHFLNAIEGESHCAAVPVVSVKEQSSEEDSELSQPVLSIDKTAVIKDGEVKLVLDTDECQGLGLITQKAMRAVINVTDDDGESIGIGLKKYDSRVTLSNTDDSIVCKISLTLKAEDGSEDSGQDRLLKKAEQDLQKQCKSLLQKTCTEQGCDIIGLDKLVRFYYPQIYLEYQGRFDELIKKIGFDVSVSFEEQ